MLTMPIPADARLAAFPKIALDSTVYRNLVNGALAEQNVGLQWQGVSMQGADAYLQLEVVAAPDAGAAIQLDRSFTIPEAIQAFRAAEETVETRRQAMVQAAAAQMVLRDPPTDARLKDLNPAERAWLEKTSDALAQIADDICAAQTTPWSQEIEAWVETHGTALDKWHYRRIRTPELPLLLERNCPTSFENSENYASSVSCFPPTPSYNAMLPADFSKEELAHLETFPPEHPVRLPYTVVERASDADVAALTAGPLKEGGREIRWLVTGLDGRQYSVTHILFHPRYVAYFRAFADILEDHAQLQVGDSSLDPTFRDYLLEMATCLRNGDMERMLNADLNQTKGDLYLSFFPHESYWADNMKFPWSFAVGLRDHQAINALRHKAYAFAALEEKACTIAARVGAPPPTSSIATDEIEKSVQVVWFHRNGGYLRTCAGGEVLGHDYPKVVYPGVAGHRAVIIADPVFADEDILQGLAAEFLPPEDAAQVNATAVLENIVWHEGSHGVSGNKPDTVVVGGAGTFGVVYGKQWGNVVEPQSDTAVPVAHEVLFSNQDTTEAEMNASLRSQFVRLLRKFVPKEKVLSEKFDAPHSFGATISLGWLYLQGNIVELGDDGLFQVDWERFAQSQKDLWDKLTEFGFQNSSEAFREFCRQCVAAIPDPIQKRILEGLARKNHRFLLNRGHLKPAPLGPAA